MMLFGQDTEIVINPVVIHEVRSRECLWNPQNVYYKNKIEKYKAWEEVSVAVLPKYMTCSEDDKRKIVRAVQSRWETARDAYMRNRLTEVKKPIYEARHTNRYIYQDELRFLEKVKDIAEGMNNRVNDDEEGSSSFDSDSSATQSSFSSFLVCDDDVGEASDEVTDFDINIHDNFKENIKDVVTAIDEVNDKAVNDDNEDECLPGTSSQKRKMNQKHPLATLDVNLPPSKRPCNARTKKLKSNKSEFETKLLEIMRLTNSISANDDQFFFKSLTPLIDNFDIHQKRNLRSKILEAVMEVGNIGPVNIKQETDLLLS